jgi:hypothetical protein
VANNFQVTQGVGTVIAAEQGPSTELYQKIKLIDPTPGSTDGIGILGNPIKIDPVGTTPQPVTGVFWPTTQPVSGAISISNFPASQAVIGTFWQATQPVSVGNFPASQAVTGTFWPATQPVSLATAPTTPVTGTFWQATQPVSLASSITTVEDYATGKTAVMKTGTLVTTATTADQVVLTYTVTSGKTFYLLYYAYDVRLTAISATASILGTVSVETPSGTKVITTSEVNPTTSETSAVTLSLPVPIPIASGTVIRIVCTPAATTSMTWLGNIGGYEK